MVVHSFDLVSKHSKSLDKPRAPLQKHQTTNIAFSASLQRTWRWFLPYLQAHITHILTCTHTSVENISANISSHIVQFI